MTPGNPATKTTEIEFRYLKMTDYGVGVDFRYNPIEFLGDNSW